MLSDRIVAGISSPYLASRSKMRNLGADSKGNASRNCWTTPQAGGMLADVEMQDSPTIVANDEKAIEQVETDRRHGEEIHSRDGFSMIAQKSEPALGWLRISRSSFHPARNRPFRDIETEHEKLAMDARRPPGWTLGGHPEDQFPNFSRDLPSPDALPAFGDQPPIQAETGSVPTNYGFGRHDEECSFPS